MSIIGIPVRIIRLAIILLKGLRRVLLSQRGFHSKEVPYPVVRLLR